MAFFSNKSYSVILADVLWRQFMELWDFDSGVRFLCIIQNLFYCVLLSRLYSQISTFLFLFQIHIQKYIRIFIFQTFILRYLFQHIQLYSLIIIDLASSFNNTFFLITRYTCREICVVLKRQIYFF